MLSHHHHHHHAHNHFTLYYQSPLPPPAPPHLHQRPITTNTTITTTTITTTTLQLNPLIQPTQPSLTTISPHPPKTTYHNTHKQTSPPFLHPHPPTRLLAPQHQNNSISTFIHHDRCPPHPFSSSQLIALAYYCVFQSA